MLISGQKEQNSGNVDFTLTRDQKDVNFTQITEKC